MRKLSGLIVIAILFANASYAEGSQESLFERMKRECRSGDSGSCGLLGQYYVEGKDSSGSNTPQDIALGMKLITASCNAGDLFSCNKIGLYYKDGKYIQVNKYKAAQIFQTVCDAGERGPILSPTGFGCFYLGIMTENGEGVPKNTYKAHELHNKACTLGIDFGCQFARNIEQGI